MSVIKINGNTVIINDIDALKDITELIQHHMGDDMAEYVEQTLKEKYEQQEILFEELKSAGQDLSNLLNKDYTNQKNDIKDGVRIEKLIEGISDVYSSIFDLLADEYGLVI